MVFINSNGHPCNLCESPAYWPWLGPAILDDIYKILHTIMYCLGGFQSKMIEVS